MPPAPPTYRRPQNTPRAILLIVSAAFLFACADALAKEGMAQGSEMQAVWFRGVFMLLLAAFVTRRQGFAKSLRSRLPWLQTLRGVLYLVQLGVIMYAFKHMPLADVIAIAMATPIFVAALSVPILGEHVGIRRWCAIIVGCIGILTMFRFGLEPTAEAAPWALVCTVLFAIFQITVRILGRYDSAQTTMAYGATIGFVGASLVVPLYWEPLDLHTWVTLTLAGATAALGAYAAIVALQSSPAGPLQPFWYLNLVFATLFGFLFFKEIPDGYTSVGAVIVVGSGLYTFVRERKADRVAHSRQPPHVSEASEVSAKTDRHRGDS
jgi:drug/metabolite transporter (DMT)-like permease